MVIGRLQFDLPPGIDPVTLFDYYRVGAEGHWGIDRNILLRKEHDDLRCTASTFTGDIALRFTNSESRTATPWENANPDR